MIAQHFEEKKGAPVVEDRSIRNVMVNFIPAECTDQMFATAFSPYGEFESANLVKERDGKLKGYGFVLYKTSQGAQNAIQALNGAAWGNKTLKVHLAGPKQDEKVKANLYVSGFPKMLSESQLIQVMKTYGDIEECSILRDRITGQSKGVAFVKYYSTQCATAAINALHGKRQPDGSAWTVKYARNESRADSMKTEPMPQQMGYGGAFQQPQGGYSQQMGLGGFQQQQQPGYNQQMGLGGFQQQMGGMMGGMQGGVQTQQARGGGRGGGRGVEYTLFVCQIPQEGDDNGMKQLFQEFGEMTQCRIIQDRQTGNHKGFGFVSYRTLQAAQNAISQRDGYTWGSKTLQVRMKT